MAVIHVMAKESRTSIDVAVLIVGLIIIVIVSIIVSALVVAPAPAATTSMITAIIVGVAGSLTLMVGGRVIGRGIIAVDITECAADVGHVVTTTRGTDDDVLVMVWQIGLA